MILLSAKIQSSVIFLLGIGSQVRELGVFLRRSHYNFFFLAGKMINYGVTCLSWISALKTTTYTIKTTSHWLSRLCRFLSPVQCWHIFLCPSILLEIQETSECLTLVLCLICTGSILLVYCQTFHHMYHHVKTGWIQWFSMSSMCVISGHKIQGPSVKWSLVVFLLMITHCTFLFL